jgi:hypothetical protein
MENHKQKSPGIFPHLVNAAAFIDKVEIEIWGKKRSEILHYIEQEKNRAIGGFGRVYARCIPGRNTPTGNQLQLKYGSMLPYKNISPFALVLWAGRLPVTCADVMLAMNGFMRVGCRARVTRVELTFDTAGIPLDRFTRDLCTTARTFREIDGEYGTTVYVGGVTSMWQLRIYQKTYELVRIEFVLRSTFLRNHGIVRPQELSLLRKTNVWQHASFRTVDQSHGDDLPRGLRTYWMHLGHGVPPDMPASIIQKLLRESRVDPSSFVVRSPREELLRKMLKNLIW